MSIHCCIKDSCYYCWKYRCCCCWKDNCFSWYTVVEKTGVAAVYEADAVVVEEVIVKNPNVVVAVVIEKKIVLAVDLEAVADAVVV